MIRKQNYLRNIMKKITFPTKIVLIVILLFFFLNIFEFKINLIILLFSLLIINILYYNQKIRMIEYKMKSQSSHCNNDDIVENFEYNVVENEKKYTETNPYCKPFTARINYHCKSKDNNTTINNLNNNIIKHLREDIDKGETTYFQENIKKNKYGNPQFYTKTSNQSLVGAPNPKTFVPPIIAPRSTDLEYWRMNDQLNIEIINDDKERYEFESGYDVTFQPDTNYSNAPTKSNSCPYKRLKKNKTMQPNYSFSKDMNNNGDDDRYNIIENFCFKT